MLFNSLEFAVFLPIVLAIYWLIGAAHLRLQNVFLIAAGYFFYGWWDWRFLSLLAFSSFLDFALGILIGNAASPPRRKAILGVSIAANLGFLGFFKYFNFFVAGFADSFSLFGRHLNVSTLNIVLPVGISFYTFQSLSYTIDVYRKRLEPARDMAAYFAFVGFFPQLLAGPIERATNLLPQFMKMRTFDPDAAGRGLKLILLGAFKKIVVADTLALYVDSVYGNIGHHSSATLAVATVFFAFQIYCDFSGYSDMAKGIAALLGFSLMTNFARPYFSASIKEFWGRWHISLSTWFRDYLYIPLGGNRGGTGKTYRNYLVTFAVSGIWHGANWTFLVWGILHGTYLIAEDALSRLAGPRPGRSGPARAAGILLTFSLVSFAWIFFRCRTLADAFLVIRRIGALDTRLNVLDPLTFANSLAALGLLVTVEWMLERGHIPRLLPKPMVLRYAIYSLAVIFIMVQGSFNNAQFIYFQF